MLQVQKSSNPQFEKFFQLEKLDEFQGIAVGVAAAEELDHDNEILDYFASKPYFQQWSDSQFKASGGKSKGNVRLQHDAKTCVGKLLTIDYDDATKQVRVSAKIVDPVAKELLREGVLTGFSIGGDYIKKTPLPNGAVRYVANPSELSVCDRPCAPSATYSVVKGDGSVELRKFAKPQEKQMYKTFFERGSVSGTVSDHIGSNGLLKVSDPQAVDKFAKFAMPFSFSELRAEKAGWHPIARESSAASRGIGTLKEQQERAVRLADHHSATAAETAGSKGKEHGFKAVDASRAARWADRFDRARVI